MEKRGPRISIVVPVYNGDKYLRRCLDSILAQTFTDYECIVVDDGSSDSSPAICDGYAARDSRFRVIHRKNAGVSAARNAGLDAARGEWIGFADSDDWCEPEMFQVLYGNAVRYDADVSMCGIRRPADGKSAPSGKTVRDSIKTWSGFGAALEMFAPGSFGGYSCNKLTKSCIVSRNGLRYDEETRHLEDVCFFQKIFKYSTKVVYTSKPCYNYFANPESVTVQRGLTGAAKTGFAAFDRMFSAETSLKLKRKITAAKTKFAVTLIRHYLDTDDFAANEDFVFLKEIIVRNEGYVAADFSATAREKILCFLAARPRLYVLARRMLGFLKYRRTPPARKN